MTMMVFIFKDSELSESTLHFFVTKRFAVLKFKSIWHKYIVLPWA